MNAIAALFEPAGLGLATELQPANLIVLVVGVLLGAVLSWLASGIRVVAWLAVMAPLAQALEPLAGVALLTGALCGGAGCGGPFDIRRMVWTLGLIVAAGLVMTLIAPWLGPVFRSFKAVDRMWMSTAAMTLAVLSIPVQRTDGRLHWDGVALAGAGVMLATIAVSMSGARFELSSVALGLLGIGALVASLLGSRTATATGGATGDGVLSILPWFALGLPVTAATALMADALSGHGLAAGPALLMSRPKIGWGIWAACLMAVLLAMVLAAALSRVRLAPSESRGRMVAGFVLAVVCVGLGVRGVALADVILVAGSAAVGFGLMHRGIDPAPLFVGLVIGQLGTPDFGRAMANGFIGLVTGAQWLPMLILLAATVLGTLARYRREQEAR